MPLAVCTRCTTIIPLGQSRCTKHQPPNRAKAKTHARGYGWAHQQERKRLTPLVNTGGINCHRCRQPIKVGQPWDLGHDDKDRTRYTGPEHESCNRGRRRSTYTPPTL